MIAAVDTNILLDVLIPNEPFCESSKELLDRFLSKGKLIICEIVLAELAAQFLSKEDLKEFLLETGMRVEYSNEESLYRAGMKWKKYLEKSQKNRVICTQCGRNLEITCPHCRSGYTRRLQVLSDFIIGAHAEEKADCLLSRDLGIYKNYFPELKVVRK